MFTHPAMTLHIGGCGHGIVPCSDSNFANAERYDIGPELEGFGLFAPEQSPAAAARKMREHL